MLPLQHEMLFLQRYVLTPEDGKLIAQIIALGGH